MTGERIKLAGLFGKENEKPLFERSYIRIAIVVLLFVSGFMLRLNYITNGAVMARQHDAGSIGNSGHIGYIDYIYENGSLPDFDVRTKWQFYHPPLHHAIAACWIGIQTQFGVGLSKAMNNVLYLTLIYSMLTLFVCYKLFRLLGLKSGPLYAVTALAAFHPEFIILSGSINNDCLSVLFTFCAIYFAVKWYKTRSFPDIVFLALSIGLGMATKLSVWYIAPATALLFLLAFTVRGAKRGRLAGEFGTFAAICCPLGLFWPVRNYLSYGVPPAYVPRLSVTHTQYIGFRSVGERLFDVLGSFKESVWICCDRFGNGFFEYNLVADIIKTSVFDEYRVGYGTEEGRALAVALVVCNVIIIAFSLFCGICLLIKKRPDSGIKWFFATLWFTVMASYTVFCFSYPHDCSMNFRYIVPTLAVGLVSIGVFAFETKSKFVKYAACALCWVFAAISAALYTIAF